VGNVNNRENENESYSVHDRTQKYGSTFTHTHRLDPLLVDDRNSANNEMICNFINNFINK
jgi:hypothetical protein